MGFRRIRRFAALAADAVRALTVDAAKAAAAFLFEPSFRVRGHVHLSCDEVRVNVHPFPSPTTEVSGMSNDELNTLANAKSRPGKMRGARPASRAKLAAAMPFHRRGPVPMQFAVIPARLGMYGNDQYGDCVSAEEAFAKACNSPEIDIDDQVVIRWARDHGFLDGANLTDVMDAMKSDGFPVPPNTFNDGAYMSVDYSTEATLQAAIATGPVKIGIDADALPPGAGNENGWYTTDGRSYRNEDHCVPLCGYGPAGWLYQQLGVPLPSGLNATTEGYLLFTWRTIGFVTHQWIMGTCGEAWVRNPTTVIVGPTPNPTPTPPPPTPTPIPAQVGSLVLTQPLQPGTYPIGPGLALVVGKQEAIPWALLLQILIAFLNGLVPVIPPLPVPTPIPTPGRVHVAS